MDLEVRDSKNTLTPKQIILRIRSRNMTIYSLAQAIGYSPGTLSRWLRTGDIPPYGMDAIMKALK